MSAQTNTIALNGKIYDIHTGMPLGNPFATRTKKHTPHESSKETVAATLGAKKQITVHTPASAAHRIHHKINRSKTLMRSAVKKPGLAPPAGVAPQTTVSVGTHAHLKINKDRTARAQAVHKSEQVSRFGGYLNPVVTKHMIPVSVKHAPEPPPPYVSTQHRTATPDLLSDALTHANSHAQPHITKLGRRRKVAQRLGVSKRAINVGSALLLILILGGFFAWQNISGLQMRTAAQRAGFHASLPSYQPAGFSRYGSIAYRSGVVTLSYRSNSDGRAFTVTQQSGAGNANKSVKQLVGAGSQNYQTITEHGKTVYLYGASNAAWSQKGIFYQVEGNAQLSSDQLLKLAASF